MDKQKMSTLKVLIRQVVHEELEAVIPDIISEIKKAVDTKVKMMTEEIKKTPTPPPAPKPARPSLTREKIASIIGAEFDGDTFRASTATMRAPAPPPDEVPPISSGNPTEDVVRAITRDYSDVMRKLNELRPDVKGVYRS